MTKTGQYAGRTKDSGSDDMKKTAQAGHFKNLFDERIGMNDADALAVWHCLQNLHQYTKPGAVTVSIRPSTVTSSSFPFCDFLMFMRKLLSLRSDMQLKDRVCKTLPVEACHDEIGMNVTG